MTDFAHVEDKMIRSVLNGDISEDAICYTLHETQKAFEADEANEDIPLHVLNARGQAIEDATEWWNEEGNVFETLECLKKYWSV